MAGCGGFGSVYLARTALGGSEVAQHGQRSRPGSVTQLATLASWSWLSRLRYARQRSVSATLTLTLTLTLDLSLT